jgi:bifunctional non-homologous end joining protein LigD
MKPMLCSNGTPELLDHKNFIFEPKLDGVRALCYKKTKLKFTSRNDIVITEKYPEFDFFDNIDAEECILDGEIVVYDEEGHPSFGLWMERDKAGEGMPATYVVFDIIYYNGKSLMNEPLYVRKKILEKIITEGEHLQTCFYTKNGKALWKLVNERKLEGVIAKKYDSSYELAARSSEWRKIKLTHDIDCVIVGFTTEKRQLTSLALGLYKEGALVYAGKVGTGFDEKTMASLRAQLDGLVLEEAALKTEKGVIAVEPVLVAEINYLNITKQGKLRAPVFKRLREDKDPEECVLPHE